ncbi:MAG: dipeptide epimerase, partial [Gemmatimonadaceae bacterium]|nr:dipeptide epimerase [Gemmatimonadaceae bacterium]
MQLHAEILTVTTRHPFIIARGGQSSYRTVFVRVVDRDGAEGWGEAAPSRYYGETADSALLAVQQFAPLLANADAWSMDAIERELEKTLRGNAAARCAVSAALHDLAARRLAVPLWKYWGLDRAAAPRSSFTIGIAPDEATLRARVREAAHYPILKIKLGSSWDREVLRIVREEAPKAQLRVDANAAWTAKQALGMLDALHAVGVDMLEQPLPPQDLDGLRFVRERAAIAVVADESCLVASDIPRLAGVVDGVNIKLAKCGSLREALRMIAVARAHDMRVMCGCMIETTLGIAAAAH